MNLFAKFVFRIPHRYNYHKAKRVEYAKEKYCEEQARGRDGKKHDLEKANYKQTNFNQWKNQRQNLYHFFHDIHSL